MSLTTGRGPLSKHRAGRFTAPVPTDVVYVEPLPRRVRGMRNGDAVVDSERVVLVHRPSQPPTYAFPVDDVRAVDTEVAVDIDGYVYVPWDAVESWFEEDER